MPKSKKKAPPRKRAAAELADESYDLAPEQRIMASDLTLHQLFQQQTSEGWGTPAQVEDPAHSTNSFLSVMKQFYPDNRWEKGDIGDICQAVQRSGDPGAYDPEVDAATKIVGQLW